MKHTPKKSDFMEGKFTNFDIYIQEREFSIPRRYMGTGWETKEQAEAAKERIIKHYKKVGKEIYSIEVRPYRSKKLKHPISVG